MGGLAKYQPLHTNSLCGPTEQSVWENEESQPAEFAGQILEGDAIIQGKKGRVPFQEVLRIYL